MSPEMPTFGGPGAPDALIKVRFGRGGVDVWRSHLSMPVVSTLPWALTYLFFNVPLTRPRKRGQRERRPQR